MKGLVAPQLASLAGGQNKQFKQHKQYKQFTQYKQYKQFKQLKQYKHKQKLTNFEGVFIVDRVVCGKSDGNIKDAEGQVWAPRVEIKLIAHLSAEEIAFPCEVFSKFY